MASVTQDTSSDGSVGSGVDFSSLVSGIDLSDPVTLGLIGLGLVGLVMIVGNRN